MLALYRRRQVEWALWRLTTDSTLEHLAPYEFSQRIAELLRQGIGQASPKAAVTQSVYSPLDALLLWVALELTSCGVKLAQAAALVRELRRDVAGAPTGTGMAAGAGVLVLRKRAANPYDGGAEPSTELSVLASSELQGVVEASLTTPLLVLPVQPAALMIANFLAEAPTPGKGRRS